MCGRGRGETLMGAVLPLTGFSRLVTLQVV
jgi:hypothetical protein